MDNEKKTRIESLQQQMRWARDHAGAMKESAKAIGDREVETKAAEIADDTCKRIKALEAIVKAKTEGKISG